MAKLRTTSADSKWCRFVNWVNGTTEITEREEVHESAKKEQSVSSKLGNLHGDTKLNQRLDDLKERCLHIFNRANIVLSVLICFVVVGVLLYTVTFMPRFGDAGSPVNNEVSERYITKGMQETGAVNIVTGMILDYRAFDTFGESNVLFVAACAVLILLRLDGKKKKVKNEEHEEDVILQRVATCLIPPVLVFGCYVILNGHLSPGGGFSGGAILGAGLILYENAFGFQKTERFFTMKTYKTVTFLALLFYGLSKSYSFFMGANHLHSGIPLGTPGDILSAGLILPLNICVGLVVACTMYGFYALFRKGGI